MSPESTHLQTERLLLRPTAVQDVEKAFVIQSQWGTARMLRMASYPPDRALLHQWFAEHSHEWSAGTAYRFAIELNGNVIGIVDIDEIRDFHGELGYWLDKAYWGNGYASEAANAVVRFAFEKVGLTQLISGHAVDNPASGNILSKLGFHPVEKQMLDYIPRGEKVWHQSYVLTNSPNRL